MKDLKFLAPILIVALAGAILSLMFYNIGWNDGAADGYDRAKKELAGKAIAYVAPQIHKRVTENMTENATTLKTMVTEIEKRTWPDVIQSDMETLAKLYRRAVSQLESHEINGSAQRFLSAATSDTHDLWSQVNEKVDELMVANPPATVAIRGQLDNLKRDGSYSLMSSLQFLSAALMLEENGFGEDK